MYVCQTLDEASNTCMEWVEQAPSMLQMLAITYDQALMIAQAIFGVQALVLAGVLVISFVKSEIRH